MKKSRRFVGWVALLLLAIVGYSVYRIAMGKPFSINLLANRQALEYLVRNPEMFTSVGIIDGTIFDRHSGKLAAVGVQRRDDDYALIERFVAEVRQFDRAKLDRQDQITYDIMLDLYQSALAFKRFSWLSADGADPFIPSLYAISPMRGAQVQLPSFLQSSHMVKNEKTARNYVKRLESMGEKLDALTAEMYRQANAGVILPISLLEKAEIGIRDIVNYKPEENPLVLTFIEKMTKVRRLDEAQKSELARAAAEAIRNRVYPAYARMTSALETERAAATTQAAGVGRLPDGAAYYALCLKKETTTEYTPEQVHALGLAEVARIEAQMDALLKAQGLASGTVAVRMNGLMKDARFLFPNTDGGRKQMLARYQQILDEVNAVMPEYFRTLPTTRLTVNRVPTYAEKGSTGAYYQAAAMDGSRPGKFFVNLRDLSETCTWGMKTVAYHEGVPGHHFQISVALNLKGLPLIRRQAAYASYVEGWAKYAERFASEIGMYKNDPLGDLGRLRGELISSVGLVVDTGLHAKGWTRERAIDYMVYTVGLNESEAITAVERFMGLPGQACAYKVGQLKILELRERAKAALGREFNVKDFHTAVLENGIMPLTILEKYIDEWITKTKG